MKINYQIDDFMEHCVEKGLSKKTMSSYEQTLILFAGYLKNEHGVNDAGKVTQDMIREYIEYVRKRGKYTVAGNEFSKDINHPDRRRDYGKKVSDVTINNYLRNIKVFFSYLEEYRIIRRNPAKKVKHIKVARKPLQFLKDADFKNLLSCIDISRFPEYRDYVIINTLFDTGMRVGECLQIEVINIDFKERVILLPANTTKGKKSRYVFFSQQLAVQLKRWLQYKDRYLENDLLFPTIRNTPLTVPTFETNLRKYGEKAGLDNIHPHMLRNNFAKRFLMSGGDIYTLSRILGHSSVEVTEKEYLDLDITDLKKQYAGHSPLSNMRR